MATQRALARLLRPVTLDGEPADRLVDELHVGHGLVVADLEQAGRVSAGASGARRKTSSEMGAANPA